MPVVIVKLTFLVLILSGLSSLVLTPLLRNLAFRRGWVDQPDGLVRGWTLARTPRRRSSARRGGRIGR